MKKYLMIITILLFVLLFSACHYQMNKNDDLETQKKTDEQSNTKEQSNIKEQTNVEKPDDSWKSAYKDTIRNAANNLIDPYDLRLKTNEWFYLGIHDFDHDGISELIFGDGSSIGVFTYKNNTVEKVTDLYEPEDWMVINGLHYKNNSIVLESDGSNGIGYVCFTYYEGEYITGSHDDYNPKEAILNDKKTVYEEFNKLFSIADLMNNSNIPLINIKGNNSNMTITLSESKADIKLDNLDFNDIMW